MRPLARRRSFRKRAGRKLRTLSFQDRTRFPDTFILYSDISNGFIIRAVRSLKRSIPRRPGILAVSFRFSFLVFTADRTRLPPSCRRQAAPVGPLASRRPTWSSTWYVSSTGFSFPVCGRQRAQRASSIRQRRNTAAASRLLPFFFFAWRPAPQPAADARELAREVGVGDRSLLSFPAALPAASSRSF